MKTFGLVLTDCEDEEIDGSAVSDFIPKYVWHIFFNKISHFQPIFDYSKISTNKAKCV